MHQTVPKTKSHAGTSPYGGFHPYNSGVRDCRHPKGARSMPGKDEEYGDDENRDDQVPEDLDPTSEENADESLSEEFIAERHRFLEWVFHNGELQKHLKSHISKMRIPVDKKDELIEEVLSRVYEYLTSGYGKDNKFQTLWRAFENQHNSGRKDPVKDLLACLKNTCNTRCIDYIKSRTILNPNDDDVKAGGPKYIGRIETTADIEILDNSSQNNDPQVHIDDSRRGNRIRECLRKDCRSKYLATYLQIINLWEEGVHKPVDICLKIPGLTPKTYNDIQGSLREFLKKNVNCWLNDEDEEVKS